MQHSLIFTKWRRLNSKHTKLNNIKISTNDLSSSCPGRRVNMASMIWFAFPMYLCWLRPSTNCLGYIELGACTVAEFLQTHGGVHSYKPMVLQEILWNASAWFPQVSSGASRECACLDDLAPCNIVLVDDERDSFRPVESKRVPHHSCKIDYS